MRKSIIIEGPDGAGKTTLVEYLRKATGLPLAPRHSSSLGGAVQDVDALVDNRPEGPHIYDRHRIISGPIYDRVLKGHLTGRLADSTWFGPHVDWLRTQHVVFCLPGLAAVTANVNQSEQLAGVRDHIQELYNAYELMCSLVLPASVTYSYLSMLPHNLLQILTDRESTSD